MGDTKGPMLLRCIILVVFEVRLVENVNVPYQLYHRLSQSLCDTWHFASEKDEIYTGVANLHCV